MIIVEHLTVKELCISFMSWWRPKWSWKYSEYWTSIHQVSTNTYLNERQCLSLQNVVGNYHFRYINALMLWFGDAYVIFCVEAERWESADSQLKGNTKGSIYCERYYLHLNPDSVRRFTIAPLEVCVGSPLIVRVILTSHIWNSSGCIQVNCPCRKQKKQNKMQSWNRSGADWQPLSSLFAWFHVSAFIYRYMFIEISQNVPCIYSG